MEPQAPIVAGSLIELTLTLTVGSYGIDEGGTIKMAQRFASDAEPPQFDRPAESGYTTVGTNGAARLHAHFEKKGHERPWMHCLVIDVYDGTLAPGDKVWIVLGDRSQGSPGFRAQSFQETAHEFRFFVDPTNACVARPLAASPQVPIIAAEMAELICLVPTQAMLGESVEVFVAGKDCWGNPTGFLNNVKLSWEGDGKIALKEHHLTFQTPGRGRILAESADFKCHSNPITCKPIVNETIKGEVASGRSIANRGASRTDGSLATPGARTLHKFWGDLHAQTATTIGTGTDDEYFTFARDQAKLDFCSHQANDFQLTDSHWKDLNNTVREFHQDHKFVVFPGYEWSGNTTAGGDRNVFYLHEDLPLFRSSPWQLPEPARCQHPLAHPADALFKRLHELGSDKVIVASHVGGRYANVRQYFDQTLAPLVEVVSCWGVFEWLLWDAFECGYVVGIMCNSDGHKGRPGAEGPGAGQFGIANGLTCVLAEELTRAAIFNTLKNRRCYGTTGARIDLDFSIENQPMGSVLKADKPSLAVQSGAMGTGPIEAVELYEGRNVIASVQPEIFSSRMQSSKIRIRWSGSRMRGRSRRVCWNGHIRINNAKITSATTFAFDSPSEGIVTVSDHEVSFRSQTTGDVDGIELTLDHPDKASLAFNSEGGKFSLNLAKLRETAPRYVHEMGGLDMKVIVERYPEEPSDTFLELNTEINPPHGQVTPYFVKVTQCDGEMAWASPIYISAPPMG